MYLYWLHHRKLERSAGYIYIIFLYPAARRAEMYTVARIPQRKNGSQTVFIPSSAGERRGGRLTDAEEARRARIAMHYTLRVLNET